MSRILVFTVFLLSTAVFAGKPAVFQKKGKAIRGYDTVAYHLQNRPVEGKDAHTHQWNGATWYFASRANLNSFKADPEKYAPQYGGYCAYAVAKGSTAKTEPDAWKIVDGKLYLNYDRGIQKKWEKDITGYIEKADANWPKVLK
ncbi:MAG: YHS domain-containing (seleno)protein [Acidobacteriota bacterium]|nr:YHS domain-containing (seleno)protein [Acidobacteriota bacterium]